MATAQVSFDEFRVIHAKASSGELEFGGLQLALHAFDDLVDDEPDSEGDEEAGRAPAAEAAPAKASFFGLGPPKAASSSKNGASSPPFVRLRTHQLLTWGAPAGLGRA